MSPYAVDLISHHQFGWMGIGVGGVVSTAYVTLATGVRVMLKQDKPRAIISPLLTLAFASWQLIEIVGVIRSN